MSIKQVSVFLENMPGKIADFTGLLKKNKIDLISLCIADTTNYGIVRAIISNYEEAEKLISENGYTVKLTDVIAVLIPDRPGGLADALDVLNRGGIAVEYLYSAVRGYRGKAVIIFRVDQLCWAEDVLKSNGFEELSQNEISCL